jgi:hypothetical protein
MSADQWTAKDVADVLRERHVAEELRRAWFTRQQVRVTLSDKSTIDVIVGRVSSVSVTGAYSTIDGWQVPTEEIVQLSKPTIGDLNAYADEMHQLRVKGGEDDAR